MIWCDIDNCECHRPECAEHGCMECRPIVDTGDDLHQRVSPYPEQMTPELREVLGKLCFQLAPIAHLFRAAGEAIPEKAEDEQAYVLHWLIGLVLAHGPDWKAPATKRIGEARKAAGAEATS